MFLSKILGVQRLDQIQSGANEIQLLINASSVAQILKCNKM